MSHFPRVFKLGVASTATCAFLMAIGIDVAEAQVIYAAHPSIPANSLTLDGSNLDATTGARVGNAQVNLVSVSSTQVVTTLPSPVVDGTYLVQLLNKTGKVIASFSMQFIVTILPNNTVFGSGTPGTLPVWNGSSTLTDSRIRDGSTVEVDAPMTVQGKVQALSSTSAVALEGISTGTGGGIFGLAVNENSGVIGQAGGSGAGVVGENTSGQGGTGVYGVSTSNSSLNVALGVFGRGQGSAGIGVLGSGVWQGVIGSASDGGGPTNGTAGVFTTGIGGTVLHGFRVDAQNNWTQVFHVGAAGHLTISGDAFKPGGGSWSVSSDARLKKSIEPIGAALERMLRLRGVTYEYVNPSAINELPGVHMGMVAQDVESVFPSWVDIGGDGYRRLTFRGFEALTVEAMRELDDRVTQGAMAATARIAELEQQNEELRRAIEALAKMVKTLERR